MVFADRRVLAAALGGPPVLTLWVGYSLPDEHGPAASVALHLLALAFLFYLLATLLREGYRERTVTRDAVAAALCGYLILGLAFGHAHTLVEMTIPGSYVKPAHGPGEHHLFFVLTYFSFTTLTTVGYGDIAPVGDTARALCLV